MVAGAGRADQAPLEALHERLSEHFERLREDRDHHGSGKPIFALEHDLTESEFARLEAEVQIAVAKGRLPGRAWLPFVVYAAEIGYSYRGDEYWQTFEESTPGWGSLDDRHYFRRKFEDFRDTFGGAQPTGPWARHFSIICWPITHAVLPTDLQRQLAELLFHYRHGLTYELLAQPDELGKRLAARAWQTSKRFQAFAQNTDLLGQVAAALLLGEEEEEESPYLLHSTLSRIVRDLSAERQARQWLRDAKSSATRMRTHGFAQVVRGPEANWRGRQGGRLGAPTDPKLFLRRESEGWSGMVELPDLSPLTERLPSLHSELGRLRCRVAGASATWLARGQLLFPGKAVRLVAWPDPHHPLIEFEGASPQLTALMLDQLAMSPGPAWVFRVSEPGFASEVRGKFVRPGHNYVLLLEDAIEGDYPDWIVQERASTRNVNAYSLTMPCPLEDGDLATLRQLGLGAVTDVEVRPAGFVAASWDGEGAAEWMAGESPIIALRSTRATAQCIVRVDGLPQFVNWPGGDREIFLRLPGLAVGSHLLEVALLSPDADVCLAEGSLTIVIRPPHQRPTTGSLREALAIMPQPANPTLADLWDGDGTLEVVGPPGVQVKVHIDLVGRTEMKVLATRTFSVELPVDSDTWVRRFRSHFQDTDEGRRHYEDAEACLVSVSHPELGSARIRCEREFAPLRWAAGADHEGPFVRLINNTDRSNVAIERFSFARPDISIAVVPDTSGRVRNPQGGLIRALSEELRAAVILPPHVRDLEDLRRTQVTPRIQEPPRSEANAMKLMNLANVWASARSTGDPFGTHVHRVVLGAITRQLVCLVSGGRWTRLERALERNEASVSTDELVEAVGQHDYQRILGRDIDRRLPPWRDMSPEERIPAFARLLFWHAGPAGIRKDDPRLAEFLLRVASEPAEAGRWGAEQVQQDVQLMLLSPVLLRAARLVVLGIHLDEEEDGGALYRGWSWQ